MELSGRKTLLRLLEVVCGGQILSSAALAALVHTNVVGASAAENPTTALFFLLFLTFFPAVILQVEFVKLRGEEESWWRESKGLSWNETKLLLSWCPRPLVYVCVALIAIGLAFGLFEGGTSWSSGQPFTTRHAIGFSLASMSFGAIALPVIASALRMPGEYSDHFQPSDAATPTAAK